MGAAAEEGAFEPATCVRALAAGALTGLVGGAYRLILDAVEPGRQRVAGTLADTLPGLLALAALFALGAALARWLTLRGAPEAAGSGIPAVEAALADADGPGADAGASTGASTGDGPGGIRWQRLLPVKFVAGVLSLASGLSLGREGPTVHLGAALAAAVGERQTLVTRRVLLAAGAGAGLTAAFTAPLAGLVFVLEELRRAPGLATTSAAFCAVLASHLVVALLVGTGPMFTLPAASTPALEALPLFASLGIAAGLLGVIFNRGLLAALDLFERLPGVSGAAAVGAVAALVACWLPAATGSGELAAEAVIRSRLDGGLWLLVAILAVKLALTLASYGCGVPGGIFAPQLALGATLGAIVHTLAPDGGGSLPALATAGMVGVFTGSVRAPATGLVLVVELTQSDHLLVAQMTTALAAYLVATGVRDRPVYEALRERDARR